MRTPLAWHNLAHYKVRTAAAVAGVMFAVVLIFLQLGFRALAERTASLVYDALDFDVLIRSRHTQRLAHSRPIARDRLYQAAGMAGTQGVSWLLFGYARWQSHQGATRPIMILGVPPDRPVFAAQPLRQNVALLTAPEYVLIDRACRREFGPADGEQFGDADIGREVELEHRRVRLVGHFWLGTSFDADGIAVLSEEGFRRVRPAWPADHITLGLIRLQPGVRPDDYAVQLRQFLHEQRIADVDVFTRAEVVAQERWVWLWQMSIGLIFTTGVCVALVVGSVIVYQVLSSDVANHLPEYATLKAMGYSDRYLSALIVEQANLLALLGFVPGFLVAQALYGLTAWHTRLPMEMTGWRIVGVLGLSLGMCSVSGLAALRKLRQADPADLY